MCCPTDGEASGNDARLPVKSKTNSSSLADFSIPVKAARMIDNLRRHHARGTQANQLRTDYRPRELAKLLQTNRYTLQKDRLFARKYSPRDLDDLCKLRRPNQLPLHWGCMGYLLSVPTKKERAMMQREAAEKGWTAPEIRREIKRRFGKTPGEGHGRPMKKPPTPEAVLREMCMGTRAWLKRCQRVWMNESGGLLKTLPRCKGSAAQGEIKALAADLEAVQKEAAAATKKTSAAFVIMTTVLLRTSA